MAEKSAIAWTNATWNPVRGCERVSQGCVNCYAEVLAAKHSYAGGWGEGIAKWIAKADGTREARWTGVVRALDAMLDAPLRWRAPRRIFVNSMSDLFHDDVPFQFIADVFAVMACTTRHTYQILTKRPQRMLEWFDWLEPDGFGFPKQVDPTKVWPQWTPIGARGGYDNCGPGWPCENVWLGVSAENQETFDERTPPLFETPAAVRFVSLEPLLGYIDLIGKDDQGGALTSYGERPALSWGIVGGESGSGFRPMDIDAARYIIRQFNDANVPLFVKQDNGPRPGMQGRFTAEEWALKEYPE